jgi:hypothetical protein
MVRIEGMASETGGCRSDESGKGRVYTGGC